MVSVYVQVEVCRCLLAAGADADRCDSSTGDSALHAAVREGHVDVVQALLDTGADLEVTDANGATAIGVAARVGPTSYLHHHHHHHYYTP